MIVLAMSFAVGSIECQDWQVVRSSSTLRAENKYDLLLGLSNRRSHATKTIKNETVIDAVSKAYVYQDKVAVLGKAGLAQAVLILDLKTGRRLDWFYCYQPQSIRADWIVYVEYYPNHVRGNPSDVVLLYDLSKSPLENRHQAAISVEKYPTRVGTPIYPSANLDEVTYDNDVVNPANANKMLGPPYFLLLSSNRLVFLAGQGEDFPHLRNHLVLIDLSKGPSKASIQEVQIPFDRLKKPGTNRNFLKATGMEEVTPYSVRLLVPKEEYGVDGLVIGIPATSAKFRFLQGQVPFSSLRTEILPTPRRLAISDW